MIGGCGKDSPTVQLRKENEGRKTKMMMMMIYI